MRQIPLRERRRKEGEKTGVEEGEKTGVEEGEGRERGKGRWIMMKAHYYIYELTSVWGTSSLYSLISLSIAPSLRHIT